MPKITFQPENKSVSVPAGTGLLEAAKSIGVEIDAPCGGKGTCGKCIVKVLKGSADSNSLSALSRTAVADGYVLACKTKVLDGDVEIEVPEQLGRKGGKFTDAIEDAQLVRQDLFPKDFNFDPLAIKWCITVPQPQLEDGLSDLERFIRAIQKDWGKKEIVCDLTVIRKLATTLREQDGLVTITLIREPSRYHVIAVEAGDHSTQHYGIAVDIGTTTVAVQLIYLPLAEVVATRSDYNDQITCGLDVISRINYARTPERLDELRTRVVKTINKLIEDLCSSRGLETDAVCNAVLSGNTTMVHLLLGLNPEYIRLDPYTPTVLDVPYLTAREVDINIHPESWVYISPSVGSYVGGDITAGLLCTDLATDSEEVNLFIDIGTNGEIAMGNSDFLMTCACSAGPAFEGGDIDCGMRAALGAIENVTVDSETGEATYWTIGNVKPKGICGSGMIALLANLMTSGWLDAAGKLNREEPSDFIVVDGRIARYVLATAEESGTGKALMISELDIDNIVRAKAAIYSACQLMMDQVGLTFDDLNSMYIAGGFGRFLNLEQAKIIGLIPDLPVEKFKYIGNSSLMGTYMVLVSQEYREKQLELAKRMTYMELSTDPAYMDQYTGALFLPHTDMTRFPSVKALLVDQ